MSDLDLIDNVEEGDDSSDAGMISELGNSEAVLEQNDQPHQILSFDVHGQFQARPTSKGNSLTFQPLPLPHSQQLVDDAGNSVSSDIQIQAFLRGRFSHGEEVGPFNAGNVSNDNSDIVSDSLNGIDGKDSIGLIFYRRNKFKVLGTVSVPSAATGIKHRNSQISKINDLYAEIDAIDSLEGAPVRLIHSNPKEKGTTTVSGMDVATKKGKSRTFATARTADGLPRISFQLEINKQNDGFKSKTNQDEPVTSVPLCWEKLQFRHATAKKRGTWQYFYLRLTVKAIFEDGKSCILTRSQTSAITVRGRSPQSFPNHTTKTSRNGAIPGRGRLATTQNTDIQKDTAWTNRPVELSNIHCQSALDIVPENLLFYDFSDLDTWGNNLHWPDDGSKAGRGVHGVTPYLDDADARVSPVAAPTDNGHYLSFNSNLLAPSLETHLLPSIPNLGSIFNLPNSLSSLSTNFSSPLNVNGPSSYSFPRLSSNASPEDRGTRPSASSNALNHNGLRKDLTELPDNLAESDSDETDDERRTYSYEYIPLSINDWTVPVDAVYRPHGVHAKKALNVEKSITKKRYFLSVT